MYKTLILTFLTAWVVSGCSVKKEPNVRVITEYVYLDKNCSKAEDIINNKIWLPVEWETIDINGTIYYGTYQIETLKSNFRSYGLIK